MLKRNARLLLRLSRKLWVRVVALALLSVLAAVIAPLIGPLLPWEVTDRFGVDTVRPILTVLASGMLAVTTFSLNVMVSAYRNAAAQATPRAYRLLLEDTTTQTVLATFTGGFIFSISGLLLLNAGFYEGKAGVVIFGFTVFVLLLIILAILRWIDHLSSLGNMDHTMFSIESRAATVLRARQEAPAMGARPVPADKPMPPGARPLKAGRTGYLAFVDVTALQEIMERRDGLFRLVVQPGDFVGQGEALGYFTGSHDATEGRGRDGDGPDADADAAALGEAFDISSLRSFDQDPRYGLMVLAEIGVRALSPGVNDPGTAIEATRRIERLLWDHGGVLAGPGSDPEAADSPPCDRIEAPGFSAGDLVSAGLGPIVRHAFEDFDTLVHLSQAAARLSRHADEPLADAARALSAEIDDRARAGGLPEIDLNRVAALISGPGTGG